MGTALSFALTFIDRLPGLIAAGADIAQLIRDHKAQQDRFEAEDRAPTDEEWRVLNASLDALEKRLQA